MHKSYIIAEIAQGFEGDPRLCKRFIDLAKKCGANGVKFQIFKTEEICTKDYKHYELFKNLEIDPEIWADLITYAFQSGIDFYSDIFGMETLEWINKTDVSGYKVHSTDSKNYPLLLALNETEKRIFLSTGGSYQDEIEKALKHLDKCEVILLSGFQAEPNIPEDVELDKINWLKNKFGKEIGYADHISTEDEMAVVLPSLAVLAGATFIEKHLTIERDTLQLEDYISALDPDEFIRMVALIRQTEKFKKTGTGYNLGPREEHYRKWTKKVPLASRDIPAGTILKESDFILLRTGEPYDEVPDTSSLAGKILDIGIKEMHVIQSKFLRD